MYKSLSLLALFAMLFVQVYSLSPSHNIKLRVFGGSTTKWIALAPIDDGDVTTKISLKSSSSSEWTDMVFYAAHGYYQLSSENGFVLPLSLRLVSIKREQIVLVNMITNIQGRTIDTGVQYMPLAARSVDEPADAAADGVGAAAENETVGEIEALSNIGNNDNEGDGGRAGDGYSNNGYSNGGEGVSIIVNIVLNNTQGGGGNGGDNDDYKGGANGGVGPSPDQTGGSVNIGKGNQAISLDEPSDESEVSQEDVSDGQSRRSSTHITRTVRASHP